jgi:hypothetical protein
MRYELKKEWYSERHQKTFTKGSGVVITLKSEIEELVELGCIEQPKKKEVKKNKKNN